MSISPSPSRNEVIRDGLYWLGRFDVHHAARVAGWASTAQELFWLAPKTFPPLTAAKVIAWPGETGCPLLFWRETEPAPAGYVELNPMPGEPDHLWMGHCVIDRTRRGEGLGRIMINLLLTYAFEQRHARRVSLVVFPENVGAIRCYRVCGFLEMGRQRKFFQTTNRQHVMIQMSMDLPAYQSRG